MMHQSGNPSASAELREEHQVILRVIDVLKKLVARSRSGNGFESEAFKQCVSFIKYFADACHHAKEEELFFPVLESRGIPKENGPIGMMLYEHTLARGFTAEMAQALDAHDKGDADAIEQFLRAAEQYAELLTGHIFKEDNVLFNMGDQALSPQDHESLCSKYCEVGCKSFGGKKRDELKRMADDLCEKWMGD